MDNASLGEMELEQIPKELRPNKHEHKSPWAFVIVIIILIIFGLFWFLQNRNSKIIPVTTAQIENPSNQRVTAQKDATSDLEASVGSIDIPDYSGSL